MGDDIIPLLKLHDYFRGASDDAIGEVVRVARVTQYPAGAIVHEANQPIQYVAFVLHGRLKALHIDAGGSESLFRMIERGEQFGMMVGALTETLPVRVVAIEPTTVLTIAYEHAMGLTAAHPELRMVWLRRYAGSLKKHFFGAAARGAPIMLAFVHESAFARWVAERLIGRLRDMGERIAVLSDSDVWRGVSGVRYRPLLSDGRILEREEIRRQATEWQDADRIVFDVHSDLDPERAVRLMELIDRAVYFVPAGSGGAAARRLQDLDAAARGWRDKISVAWLLESGTTIATAASSIHDYSSRDFKIASDPPGYPWGRALANGLERLVHDLRGVRIGLALGGGAARGLTHLGVLKALEESGIVVDMIAGTSAGALAGVVYASGHDPDYAARQFSHDLRPSWIFRRLPQGDQLYLLYKYRRGHFDPMLRKYLLEARLEQLPLPCVAVAVDLVSGRPVIRDRGDAVGAVLESINLPVLSVPIIRDGQALVDGGLVNNIPADVLVARGCNFVIAVSVTAKMEREFCGISSSRPARTEKKPTIVRTLLRSLLVQNHSLSAIGVQPADVVIEPDVTAFELTDFKRAREMAAVGHAATLGQITKIRQLLSRHDPRLFPLASDLPDSERV